MYKRIEKSLIEKMLYHLRGNVYNEEIAFDLTSFYDVEFDKNTTVAVREIKVDFKKATNNFTGVLKTTLVDKCPENLEQQIFFFCQKEKSHFYFEKPSYPLYYDIQANNLRNTTWSIESDNEISFVYLVLEIN